jgi:hypothetical protein
MIGAALLAAGCATGDGRLAAHLEGGADDVRECASWYRALDAEVDGAGVRDAQYTRLAGFPHLRVDRLLASLKERAAGSDAALRAYGERMAELDLEARRHEVRNLPTLNDEARTQALRRASECSSRLRAADREHAAAVFAAVQVPDDYSTVQRVLGLYAITKFPFAAGVDRWQRDTLAAFAREPDEAKVRVRFSPPLSAALPRAVVAGILARAAYDPLGHPNLSPREVQLLAAAYAPSFEVEVRADHDRFGVLRFRRGSAAPEVDAAEPTVYVNAAYTRYGEHVLVQLVYTIWFPERPGSGSFDLLAGRLDGVMWRVTLAPDGEPILYDSIHACGCFHMFFPTPRARPRPPPDALDEWAFVPHSLPHAGEDERVVLSIASSTHYIERVGLERAASLVRYAFRPYDELRSLPRAGGVHASLFGPDGIVPGTQRGERFFFWPMGIASAGAMRQWGRHATAFVGRRHFDDAQLIERRFELDL